jgi:hypothetical protein
MWYNPEQEDAMQIQIADETLVQQIEQFARQLQRSPEEVILEAIRTYMQRLLSEKQAEVDQTLAAWRDVYAGLSDEEIDEIEAIALDRSQFMN